MAYLVEQFTGDRGVQLAVESFTRAMPWGTNWTKCRVGCRVAVNGYSTIPSNGLTSGNTPLVGFCTGPESYASSVCVDAVAWIGLNAEVATYSGTPPNVFYDRAGGNHNGCGRQKIATTDNYLGNYTTTRFCWSANPSALRTPLFLDIIKASATQATFTIWDANNTQVLSDCSRSQFLATIENENAPSNMSGYSQTYTLVRQTKDWDSVFFYWGHAVPTAVFYDMTAVRFY